MAAASCATSGILDELKSIPVATSNAPRPNLFALINILMIKSLSKRIAQRERRRVAMEIARRQWPWIRFFVVVVIAPSRPPGYALYQIYIHPGGRLMEVQTQRTQGIRCGTQDRRVSAGTRQVVAQVRGYPLHRFEHEIHVDEIDLVVVQREPRNERRAAAAADGRAGRRHGANDVTDVRGRENVVIIIAELEAVSWIRIQRQSKSIIAVVLAMKHIGYVVAALQDVHCTRDIHPLLRLVVDPRLVTLQVPWRGTGR